MDQRTLIALESNLVVTVKPSISLTPRQQKEWERNVKKTLVIITSRYGELLRAYAYEIWLWGQLR